MHVNSKSEGELSRLLQGGLIVEMGRSSVNAEVRPNNLAEYSARFGSATCDYSAEVRLNFGKNSASLAALLSRYFAAFLPSRRH